MTDVLRCLHIYKKDWSNRITSILNAMNIPYKKSRPNWEKIGFMLYDKKLGILHAAPEQYASITGRTNASSSISTEETPLSFTTTSTTTKQRKLTPSDKLMIKSRYEQLEERKMWRLSTGKYIEKQMQIFALLCNFEHPVHSFVLDTTDSTWKKKYFTPEEINEIRFHNVKRFIDLPAPLSLYINQLQQLTDVSSVKQQLGIVQEDSDCEWVRTSMLNYFNLFKCGYLPPTDQSERDMLRRIWFFIDTVFDTSVILCRGGEKSSKALSSSLNSERTLAGENAMERKTIGRKLDMVYFRQSSEYGSCECDKIEDQTKQLYDGGFKMAKVSKDMLVDLSRKAPDFIRDLSVVGFLLFGAKFTIMLYDLPAGYVCRGNSLPSIYLPEDAEDINIKLIDMLNFTYKARLVMERNNNRLVRQSRTPLDIIDSINNDEVVLPCFQPEDNKQKRRSESTTKTTTTSNNDE